MAELEPVLELTEEQLESGQGSLKRRAMTRYRRHVLDNASQMTTLRERAEKLINFVSPMGSQLDEETKRIFEKLRMPALDLNEVWPTIHGIAGRESTSRYVPKLTGRGFEDAGFADACNAAIRAIREEGDYEQVDSSAFLNSHITGLSGTQIRNDVHYRTPRFRSEKVPVGEFLIDFYAREPNLRDMGAVARGQWVNVWEMQEYSPELDHLWKSLVSSDSGSSSDFETGHGGNGGVWYASTGIGTTDDSTRFYRRSSREVFRVDFEWVERIPRAEVEIPGEILDLWRELAGDDVPDEEDMDEQFRGSPVPGPDGVTPIHTVDGGPDSTVVMLGRATGMAEQRRDQLIQQSEQAMQQAQQAAQQGQPMEEESEPYYPEEPITRTLSKRQLMEFQRGYSAVAGSSYENYYDVKTRCHYRAIIVGNHVIRVHKSRENSWSLMPLVCFQDETAEGTYPYGTAQLLESRQKWLNAFANAWIHALTTMPRSQITVDPDVVTIPELQEINKNLARGDRAIHVSPESWKELPQGRVPDGIDQAWQVMQQMVPGGAGQSQYGIGGVDSLSRTAFRLVEQQISTMNKVLAEAFDSFRLYRKMQTRTLLKKIIAYWSYEDFTRAAGEEFAQHIPRDRSQWRKALEFDIVVGEEPTTRDMAMSAIESIQQTGMWMWLKDTAPKALAKMHAPVFGSEVTNDLLEGIEAQEYGKALENFAAAAGVDPEDIEAAVQQLAQGGNGEVA